MFRHFNRCDLAIVLAISLLAFGNFGGAFKPVNLLGFCVSPWVYWRMLCYEKNRHLLSIFLFFQFWLVYSVISLLWTINLVEGVKSIVYNYVHFSLLFAIVLWSKGAYNPLKSIIIGWILILLFTLPIAVWEITTLQHLSISRRFEDSPNNLGNIGVRTFSATTTFLNRNTYVFVMAFCTPFLLLALRTFKNKLIKVVLWLVLFTLVWILFINASRGGIMCLALCIIMFLLYKLDIKQGLIHKFKRKGGLILVAIAGVYVIVNYLGLYFFRFIYKMGEAGASFTSDTSRAYLYKLALSLTPRYYFMGSGTGSHTFVMEKFSDSVAAVHNMFLEVLLQYGLLVFVPFCLFLISLFLPVYYIGDKRRRFLLISFLLIFVPVFIINSNYVLRPEMWVLLACLYVIGHVGLKNNSLSSS